MYNKRVVITKTMYKIIEDNTKFKIKEIDENGNTLGLLEDVFDTHEEATAKILDLTGETPEKEEEAPEKGEVQTPGDDATAAKEDEVVAQTEETTTTSSGAVATQVEETTAAPVE